MFIKFIKNKFKFLKPKKQVDLLARMPVPYEPMRRNRFILRIVDTGEISEFFIGTLNLPRTQANVVFEMDTIKIVFRDYITDNLENLMELIRQSGSTGMAYNIQPIPRVNFEIEMLDPTGVVIHKWKLYQCRIQGVQFNMADNDPPHPLPQSMHIKPEYIENLHNIY